MQAEEIQNSCYKNNGNVKYEFLFVYQPVVPFLYHAEQCA